MTRPLGIVAVDLSLTGTGIAQWSYNAGQVAFSIKPNPKASDLERLRSMAMRISDATHSAGAAWMEQGYSSSSHGKSGSQVAELRGAVRYICGDFVEVTPASVKAYATGRGHADKSEVIEAVRLWGYDVPRKYPDARPGSKRAAEYDDNIADAIALLDFAKCAYGMAHHGKEQYVRNWAKEHPGIPGVQY